MAAGYMYGQQMAQKVGLIAVAALRGGVSAAHTIVNFTAWRAAYPYPPPRGEAGATRTYPPKKQ